MISSSWQGTNKAVYLPHLVVMLLLHSTFTQGALARSEPARSEGLRRVGAGRRPVHRPMDSISPACFKLRDGFERGVALEGPSAEELSYMLSKVNTELLHKGCPKVSRSGEWIKDGGCVMSHHFTL